MMRRQRAMMAGLLALAALGGLGGLGVTSAPARERKRRRPSLPGCFVSKSPNRIVGPHRRAKCPTRGRLYWSKRR